MSKSSSILGDLKRHLNKTISYSWWKDFVLDEVPKKIRGEYSISLYDLNNKMKKEKTLCIENKGKEYAKHFNITIEELGGCIVDALKTSSMVKDVYYMGGRVNIEFENKYFFKKVLNV